MDALSMDDQGQIRDARLERKLKLDELRLELFLRETLLHRLDAVVSALKATSCYNLTLDGLKCVVESEVFTYGKNFELDKLPCPVCGPGQCRHLHSFSGVFFGIAFSALHKIQHHSTLMSEEAWRRVFIAEVIARQESVEEELLRIEEQLGRLEKKLENEDV